jgi:hypothetical protein
MEFAGARARELLAKHRDELDRMAQALLEKEVLGPKDLVEILGPRPHGEYVALKANGSCSVTREGRRTGAEATADESRIRRRTIRRRPRQRGIGAVQMAMATDRADASSLGRTALMEVIYQIYIGIPVSESGSGPFTRSSLVRTPFILF